MLKKTPCICRTKQNKTIWSQLLHLVENFQAPKQRLADKLNSFCALNVSSIWAQPSCPLAPAHTRQLTLGLLKIPLLLQTQLSNPSTAGCYYLALQHQQIAPEQLLPHDAAVVDGSVAENGANFADSRQSRNSVPQCRLRSRP